MAKTCTVAGDHVGAQCNGEHVSVLALCEQGRVVLRPNRLYRFEVVENCKSCKELADLS